MTADIKKQVAKQKIIAYDLLQRIYASVAETKRLQAELSKAEERIATLGKSDGTG